MEAFGFLASILALGLIVYLDVKINALARRVRALEEKER